jgi:hypothetical protein
VAAIEVGADGDRRFRSLRIFKRPAWEIIDANA